MHTLGREAVLETAEVVAVDATGPTGVVATAVGRVGGSPVPSKRTNVMRRVLNMRGRGPIGFIIRCVFMRVWV